MTSPLSWCRVSHDFALQINVILLVVGVIFLLDVFSHLYLKVVMFPGLRLYPVSLRSWVFWVRILTMVAYNVNAIIGIFMSRELTVFKFVGYVLIGCVLLLYSFSIAVSRFMFRSRFEFFVKMLVLQMWINNSLSKIEVEFGCCGKTSVIDYQTVANNRTWAAGSCCEEQNCTGCITKVTQYLWTIEMDVARDNIIVSFFLLLSLIVMAAHYKYVQLQQESYYSDNSEEIFRADDTNTERIAIRA
ncbi:uncharacterized protein LOC108110343 [Drosophila eugracilis]|uniref:uncharacterized protein LOC108110343 n=1 Tax=Drosophila eugracilis TaxID=29029 RepID=UPI0007E5D0B5|nr:uncharacterized protein LOC108110343 [Drosophila eugracilis]